MIALVCFTAPDGQRCALDVAHTGAVLALGALEPLPAPLPTVLGLLRVGGERLPVVAALGRPGSHVLLVEAGTGRFGLLVGAVEGVVRVRPEELTAPPRGQARAVVRAVAGGGGHGALVLDPDVLAEGLQP